VRRVDNLATCMCRLSRNFGSLSLLDPYGPVQACAGVVLPCVCVCVCVCVCPCLLLKLRLYDTAFCRENLSHMLLVAYLTKGSESIN
jgi:hypothetical protein